MTLLFWLIFSLALTFPCVLEAYAAAKFFPYIKHPSSLIPFFYCLLSAQFDLAFSGLMLFTGLSIYNMHFNIVWTDPVTSLLTVYIVAAFHCWRIASGLIAFWFAGRLEEGYVRHVLHLEDIEELL